MQDETYSEVVEPMSADFSLTRFAASKTAIFKALAKFQAKAEHPKKNRTVSYVFQGHKTEYDYATLDNCINQNKHLLGECGLCVSQFPISRNDKVGIVTILGHENGEFMQGEYLVKPVNDKAQELGSALTYLRRYAYCAVLGLAGEFDDDGGGATYGSTKKNGASEPAGAPNGKRLGEQQHNNTQASKTKKYTQKEIQLKLTKGCKTMVDVIALWTELTLDQQKNTKIKSWFTMKKTQFANQLKELKEKETKAKEGTAEKDLSTAPDFLAELKQIKEHHHLLNFYKKHKDQIMMLPAKDYKEVSTAIDRLELELRPE